MQFVIIAKDAPDALERRMACRQDHVDVIDKLKAEGHFEIGGAMLDDAGNMAGSVLVGEFASREELQSKWLDIEPYVKNRVWDSIEVYPYKIGPSFAKK